MMNERIRKLAHEAGLPTYNPDGIPTKLEKFAELLIRECIDIAYREGDNVAYLALHFGVEE